MLRPRWTISDPIRRLLWRTAAVSLAAGAVAALLGASMRDAPRAPAEEAPAPKGRLAPDGIDGAVVLCADKAPDKALDEFCDLAGKDKAQVVVVSSGYKKGLETAEKLAEALRAHKPASVAVVDGDAKSPKLPEALGKATGAWLIGDETRPADAFRDTDAGKELRALLKRGGVVGASGAAAAALAQASVADKAGGAAGAGLGLLPGVVLDARFRAGEGEDRLFAALDKAPGSFGVGLGEGAALVVRGRRMSVLGDGTVIVCLSKSSVKPRRVIGLTETEPSDFTMLRRAALARAEAPFPPKEPQTPEVAKGALVIVGGGGMPADVTKKFIDLAGGPDANIVVLPTANPDGPPDAENGFFKRAGAKNVVALPARTLEEVEDPKNLEALKKADAVWFGGGRQWRFVDAYEGTKAYDLFHDVLRRGGVIGGSSAGATIQGGYLSRGSPLGNTEMMCEGYERGFGFLPGVAVDQHFAQRNRFADMTALIKAYPQVLGVGLDEATAIVVKGHEAEVMGKGEAHFYDGGKPVVEGRPDYEALKAGGRYDLKDRKVLEPGGHP